MSRANNLSHTAIVELQYKRRSQRMLTQCNAPHAGFTTWLSPAPRASVSITVAVKVGLFLNTRDAYKTSLHICGTRFSSELPTKFVLI
jgi:hypothetical protein